MESKRVNMTEGNIKTLLRTLTTPMIFGVIGLVAFNLADTYFVGLLGTHQIAALTFTYPVVLVLNSLTLGLGVGASAVISKVVGQGDQEKVIRLSTDSLTLGILVAIIAVILGELTIDPLFTALGADHLTMPYVKTYMQIWYAGVPFVVIPMIGNNVIRALGDIKTPSIVMMIAAIGNIILDPILIFGIGSIPSLGVAGAALATVLSRMVTFSVALYVLIVREKAISLKVITIKELMHSWKEILFIGMPNAIARMIIPIGAGMITRLIASYGVDVVAGYGIATKLEYFALTVTQALASIIPVFVGQNFGGNRIDRVKEGVAISERFVMLLGVGLYGLLFLLARPLGSLFTQSNQVLDIVVLYLRIVPLAYGLQGILLIVNGAMNALHKPIRAASVNLIQMLVIYVPLATLSSKYFGIHAIFISLVVSYFITGILGMWMMRQTINSVSS